MEATLKYAWTGAMHVYSPCCCAAAPAPPRLLRVTRVVGRPWTPSSRWKAATTPRHCLETIQDRR